MTSELYLWLAGGIGLICLFWWLYPVLRAPGGLEKGPPPKSEYTHFQIGKWWVTDAPYKYFPCTHCGVWGHEITLGCDGCLKRHTDA